MDTQQHRPNLLDLPVSVFRQAFDNLPEGITTLRRMTATKYYRASIETIRHEPDPAKQQEQKKHLRAFTPVAWLHHRKEGTDFDEKVGQQWPLLMGDIDQKDNPDVDMGELKHHLTRLPYVLLCAFSVRGGLWFVVRLPDHQTPDTLAAHGRYLQRLFTDRLGIVLDKSKGGNPTHLRYVSYDDNPYFNENPTIMSGMLMPAKPIQRSAYTAEESLAGPGDDSQLLIRLVRFTESAGEGHRHETLLKAARLAGGLVAAGRLDERNAVYALETVASEWPMFSKSQKTIRDGITYGRSAPVYAPERTAYRPAPIVNTRPAPVRPPATWLLAGTLHPGEVLSVDDTESYPADWDDPPVKPAPQLLVSPNRMAFAASLDLPANQLPLYRLNNPQTT